MAVYAPVSPSNTNAQVSSRKVIYPKHPLCHLAKPSGEREQLAHDQQQAVLRNMALNGLKYPTSQMQGSAKINTE